jgi:predicted dehydrogenase
VRNEDNVRLAVVGKLPDNDHPYSWSAILNGYDALDECPNAIIREYLTAQPRQNFGIPGVRVTHIWCDDAGDARRVARVSRIPSVVSRAEDVLGEVDAVLIPTDVGHEHLERTRFFIEANVPVFIDKPLADCEEHLRQFVRWHRQGKALMSSSALRYAREFRDCRARQQEIGDLRLLTATTCRSWERYGMHALEAAYQFVAAGQWTSVQNTGSNRSNIVHARHGSGVDVVLAAVEDMDGSLGCVALYGTKGACSARFHDSFYAFRAQLADFVSYLRTGIHPYPFAETVELAWLLIAGIRSRQEGGRAVRLTDFETKTMETPCST